MSDNCRERLQPINRRANLISSSRKTTREVIFFATAAKLWAWLAKNHDQVQEQWIGFYKRASRKPSVTWPEAVNAALCFGWIDGVRKSIGKASYKIRFTPRRPRSTWSAVNVKRVEELTRLGLMQPPGFKAFQSRPEQKSGIYSYEQRHKIKLDPAFENKLRANCTAWEFFSSQAPWYQRTAVYWIMNAKQEQTRLRRLATLIDHSAKGKSIPPLTRAPGKGHTE